MDDSEINLVGHLWELSISKAQEILDAFLAAELIAFNSILIKSIDLDYSPNSVPLLAHYVSAEIRAGRLDNEHRTLWYVRTGYYFGETLCRNKAGLSWALGSPDFAFANHPVVAGFANGEEAPVLTVSKNLITSVVEGRSPPARIDSAIELWFASPVA